MSQENRNNYIIKNSFTCPECVLKYVEGDNITIRNYNNKIVHDCDNCLSAIELEIIDNKVQIK